MHRYYIFNKPYQVMSQFSAADDKKTLAHFFTNLPKNIYPVGRLDYDSEGLLILTDDKALTNQLLDPAFAHPRTYLVQVDGMISARAIEELENGVTINADGKLYRTKKATAQILNEAPGIPPRDPPIRYRKSIPTSWLSLTLSEGKNRQVRKMTAATGYPTLRLVRYAIGAITIEGIAPGTHRLMSAGEKELLLAK